MPWSFTADVEEFAAAAGPLLRQDPARHTLMLGIVETLRAAGLDVYGTDPPLFGWWHPQAGPAAAACLRTPPFPLLITGTEQTAAELAGQLAAAGRPLPGVNASPGLAGSFAAQWRQRTGAAAHVRQRYRLFRLGTLTPPSPPPPGAPRAAASADKELLVRWWQAFAAEADPAAGAGHAAERSVDDRMSHAGLTLWQHGGEPVSMAGTSRKVAGMVRVGPVYTPPPLRRRGYAAGVTAAASRAALDAGAEQVLLFTDLANPTSNALYQRLGYRPVTDLVVLAFAGG